MTWAAMRLGLNASSAPRASKALAAIGFMAAAASERGASELSDLVLAWCAPWEGRSDLPSLAEFAACAQHLDHFLEARVGALGPELLGIAHECRARLQDASEDCAWSM
jgi:hypothetical protein